MPRTALIPALVALLSLAGCGPGGGAGSGSASAAQSASRLMAAAIAGDRVAFEAEIDRAAVREDLRRQMVQVGQARGVEVEGGPSDFTLDRMIGPDALKLVRAGAGTPLTAAPSPEQVAAMLTPAGRAKVCLRTHESGANCPVTFRKDGGRWRLVGMQAMDLTIPVAGA